MTETTLSKQDRDALMEFGTASLSQAEDRLHTGVWTQAAFDAYHYLWSLGPRVSVYRLPRLSELEGDARALVELHYEKAGLRANQWRHYGLLQPQVGQRVEVRLGGDRKRVVGVYSRDRNGFFWDEGLGPEESPPAWDEDLWRPL